MKTYLKLILPALLLMMVYSSCRKDAKAPAAQTTTNTADDLNSQVAANLANSLAGSYGGVNINDGIDSVSLANHQGPHHGCPANPLCGFFADSLVNYNCASGDTLKSHTGGNLTFFFDCVNGKPSGYTAYDSLNTTGTTSQYAFIYTVKQAYSIKALNDQHTFIDVNGDIYTYVADNYFNTSIKSIIANANYVLKDLTVDLTHQDITSGCATFKSYGTNSYGSWNLNGTIVFIGNHQAIVTINGKVYHVTLHTGCDGCMVH